MNATRSADLVLLLDAGFSQVLISRIAGVNRSSVARWVRGATPRDRSARRLRLAATLVGDAGDAGLDIPGWFSTSNGLLGGLAPTQWLAEDRDYDQLLDAKRVVTNEIVSTSAQVKSVDLAMAVLGLNRTLEAMASVDLSPILASFRMANQIGFSLAMASDAIRSPGLLAAAASATQATRMLHNFDGILRGHIESYSRAFSMMSSVQSNLAFAGIQDVMRDVNLPLLTANTKLVSAVLSQHPVALGSLGVALDLQLAPAIQTALSRYRALLEVPFGLESAKWRSWLPTHPAALIRSSKVESEWLIGHTHMGAQLSVASLNDNSADLDEDQFVAASESLTMDFPSLLEMELPGGGQSLRAVLWRLAPEAVEPFEGGLMRIRDGGLDAARQAAASFRAALDQVANAIAPGPKKQREEAYLRSLGVDRGDSNSRLIILQVQLLYSLYEPMSGAVHDELDLPAVRTYAVSLASVLAAVLAQWLRHHPSPE